MKEEDATEGETSGKERPDEEEKEYLDELGGAVITPASVEGGHPKTDLVEKYGF